MTTNTVSARKVAMAMKITVRDARRKLKGVPFTEAAVRGGKKRLYRIEELCPDMKAAVLKWIIDRHQPKPCLPAATQAARAGTDLPAASAATAPPLSSSSGAVGNTSADAISFPTPSSVGHLAQWQIEVAGARGALLEECARIAAAASISVARAEQLLCERAGAGALQEDLLSLMRTAHARRGKNGRTLSAVRL